MRHASAWRTSSAPLVRLAGGVHHDQRAAHAVDGVGLHRQRLLQLDAHHAADLVDAQLLVRGLGRRVWMSRRCSMARDARLHPAVAVAHPSTCGRIARVRCPARPGWRSKLARGRARLPGVAIQSPRLTSSWRSSTTPADSPASAPAPPCCRRGAGSATVARSPLGKTWIWSPAFTPPWAMRPQKHTRLLWPTPSGAVAFVARHVLHGHQQQVAAGRVSCAEGRLSSSCSRLGPWYQGTSSGCSVTLSPRRADTGTMPATSMPASWAKAAARCGDGLEGRAGVAAHVRPACSRRTRCWARAAAAPASCGDGSAAAAAHSAALVSSLVMSTSTTAASLPAAAVTMLRVYCSWPGASAMMNLRDWAWRSSGRPRRW